MASESACAYFTRTGVLHEDATDCTAKIALTEPLTCIFNSHLPCVYKLRVIDPNARRHIAGIRRSK